MLNPFCIFFDCGKMTLKYKSELESAKKLTEMDSNVTYCFIASQQRCSHRLGVMNICGASLRKLAVPLCSSLMCCTAFLQCLPAALSVPELQPHKRWKPVQRRELPCTQHCMVCLSHNNKLKESTEPSKAYKPANGIFNIQYNFRNNNYLLLNSRESVKEISHRKQCTLP